MIHVPINIRCTTPSNSTIEPLKISIPFKQGVLFDVSNLLLVNTEEQYFPFQYQTLAHWPDNSIKWLLIDFQYCTSKKATTTTVSEDSFTNQITEQLYLTNTLSDKSICIANKNLSSSTKNTIRISSDKDSLSINTGISTFQLNTKELASFSPHHSDKDCYHSHEKSIVLKGKNGTEYFPLIQNVQVNTAEPKSNQLTSTIEVEGVFTSKQNKTLLNFNAEITFFAGSKRTEWRFTIHNPNAIVHNNGKWDLGNENSIFFESLNAFVFTDTVKNLYYRVTDDATWQSTLTPAFELFQASSGGKNWRSSNHVDYKGNINVPFRGYSLAVNNTLDHVVGRSQPTIHCKTSQDNVSVYIENFWQNFPKKLSVTSNSICLGLFPTQNRTLHELQPGEKKSHSFTLDYSSVNTHSEEQRTATTLHVDPQYITDTNAVIFFNSSDDENSLNSLINQGLTSKNNFYQKREEIDEFGWRNFGDLYADHEAIEYKSDAELISHYNNQYDPLYGFLRQYLLTGELKWLELANDLASHVKDIDIYHTKNDRAEYNGGLFWHTDHYLPAETASHRTYSEKQAVGAYQDHAGGGGPGGQHCYTTGLMLHYFLTGDKTSKQAALTISSWITFVYEGSQTITDFLLAIKNKNRIDLKNIFTGKYPLDRGTGHYIIALIDAFDLTGQQHYLDQVSLIIKNTVSPTDDIAQRDLFNVEVTWYYTVFFQAVYRYLQTKELNSQLDNSFHYAKRSLLHYSQWMVENEAPYLHKPEILEYPNQTWTAQDIRKANVLYFAAYYADDIESQNAFIKKANMLHEYVTDTLTNEPTRDTTRILSILMQNHGIKSYCLNKLSTPQASSTEKNTNMVYSNSEKNSVEKSNIQNLYKALGVTLRTTSLSRELDWLRKRIPKVDNLLIKLGK